MFMYHVISGPSVLVKTPCPPAPAPAPCTILCWGLQSINYSLKSNIFHQLKLLHRPESGGDTHLSRDMVVICIRELEDNTDNNAYSYSFRSTLLLVIGHVRPHATLTHLYLCACSGQVFDTLACHNQRSCSCAAHLCREEIQDKRLHYITTQRWVVQEGYAKNMVHVWTNSVPFLAGFKHFLKDFDTWEIWEF